MSFARSRRSAILGTIAAGAVACSDTQRVSGPAARLDLTETAAASWIAVLDDTRGRLVPALGTEGARATIGAAIDEARQAIAARDATALRAAVDRGESALSAEPGDGGSAGRADDADATAIRLVLEQARALVQSGGAQ